VKIAKNMGILLIFVKDQQNANFVLKTTKQKTIFVILVVKKGKFVSILLLNAQIAKKNIFQAQKNVFLPQRE
jgi:hypothetical protein